jgi:hypothetical protein
MHSSSLELLVKMFALDIIPRGKFSCVEIRHDYDCPSLSIGSSFACNCDCEVLLDGKGYLYSEFFSSRGGE